MKAIGSRLLMGETRGQFDGHCHVFRADLPMIPQRRYTPAYNALPETLSKLLHTHNLDGALLIQPSFLGTDNQYLLQTLTELTEKQPQQIFKGVVVLDSESPPSITAFNRLSAQGIIGVRLNLYRSTDRFIYEKWRTVLERAESQGWHIEVHCEANMLQSVLPPLVQNHTKIVIDHFGLVTSTDQCPGLKTILRQPPEKLWIKLSAPYRLLQQLSTTREDTRTSIVKSIYKVYANFVGNERLIWGSDWPFTQFEEKVSYSDVISAGSLNYTA